MIYHRSQTRRPEKREKEGWQGPTKKRVRYIIASHQGEPATKRVAASWGELKIMSKPKEEIFRIKTRKFKKRGGGVAIIGGLIHTIRRAEKPAGRKHRTQKRKARKRKNVTTAPQAANR